MRAQSRNAERSGVQLRHRDEATATSYSVRLTHFDKVTSPKVGLGLSSRFLAPVALPCRVFNKRIWSVSIGLVLTVREEPEVLRPLRL
jgi:hypothetical protein